MNALKIFATALFIVFAATASAQTESTASVVRRAKADAQKANAKKSGGVTDRMQSFYEVKTKSDADLQWMRIIYRNLDIKQDANTCLFYPEEPNQDGQSLFFIIMRLLINNQISAYEYLDGRELFTDQYKVKVKDMLDRYGVDIHQRQGQHREKPEICHRRRRHPGQRSAELLYC